MSLIPNNLAYVTKSLIWNTLIPSHLELPYDIDISDNNEKEDDNDDDLSLVQKSEEADCMC